MVETERGKQRLAEHLIWRVYFARRGEVTVETEMQVKY